MPCRYPFAEKQRRSVAKVEKLIHCLSGILSDGTVDLEILKRLYLYVGRGTIDRFSAGKKLIGQWLSELSEAAKFARDRIPRNKGPLGHENLSWFVHEMADIWERSPI